MATKIITEYALILTVNVSGNSVHKDSFIYPFIHQSDLRHFCIREPPENQYEFHKYN
jgi:hypothetical protein